MGKRQIITVVLVLIGLSTVLGSLYTLKRNYQTNMAIPKNHNIRILENFWPTFHVDPTALQTAGDWNALQNLYATLVESGGNKTVRAALAERWEHDPQGKIWTFYLRPNLRWSDGSSMTTKQVVASLNRAHHGTTHTDLSRFVREIREESENRIVFTLDKTPPNFLTLLSFVDSAITHPQAYAGDKFTWDAPSSGAFRVVKYENEELTLEQNPNYWDTSVNRIPKAALVKGNGNAKDLDTLLAGDWDGCQLASGTIDQESQIDALKTKYRVLVGSPDFLSTLTFSKKRTTEGRLPLRWRQFILKSVYSKIWQADSNRESHRAVGLRPAGSLGSLSEAQFDQILAALPSTRPNDFPGKLEVLVSTRFHPRSIVKRMLDALKATTGAEVVEILATGNQFQTLQEKGNFDLEVNFLGASEADPDTAWRIYNDSVFAEPAATKEQLDQAQLEQNHDKRVLLYQAMEKSALDRALYVPIRNEIPYLVLSSRVEMDPAQASDWGLQLFQLRLKGE